MVHEQVLYVYMERWVVLFVLELYLNDSYIVYTLCAMYCAIIPSGRNILCIHWIMFIQVCELQAWGVFKLVTCTLSCDPFKMRIIHVYRPVAPCIVNERSLRTHWEPYLSLRQGINKMVSFSLCTYVCMCVCRESHPPSLAGWLARWLLVVFHRYLTRDLLTLHVLHIGHTINHQCKEK